MEDQKVHPVPPPVAVPAPLATHEPLNANVYTVSQPTSGVSSLTPVPSQEAVYRHQPLLVICHACGSVVTTSVRAKMGVAITGSVFALIFFGLWLGCCLLPLCVRDMYDSVHSCPNCKMDVGIYKVISC